MSTKVVGLTYMNVKALEVVAWNVGPVRLTATTAEWDLDPQWVAKGLEEAMANLPSRGHPKASLHAVLRKVRALT